MSEIKGRLVEKNETKVFGNNGFRKREFVIETDSQYPQTILIELIQDKCDLIEGVKIGENIKVSYNLNGRKWVNQQGEVKYFNSIQGWSIINIGQNNPLPAEPFEPAGELNEDNETDLPF